MKKEDYRTIEYGLRAYGSGTPKNGLFHKLISKREDNGEEYVRALIEDEGGNLKEVQTDSFRFTD